MSLVTVSLVVSDLFFMVDNSQYWAALEHSPADALPILQENAESFCYLMEKLGEDYTADEIVADFLERV